MAQILNGNRTSLSLCLCSSAPRYASQKIATNPPSMYLCRRETWSIRTRPASSSRRWNFKKDCTDYLQNYFTRQKSRNIVNRKPTLKICYATAHATQQHLLRNSTCYATALATQQLLLRNSTCYATALASYATALARDLPEDAAEADDLSGLGGI